MVDGSIMTASTLADNLSHRPLPENLQIAQDIAESDPSVAKALLDDALKAKGRSKVAADITDPAFIDKVKKRAFIKNIKQKVSFVVGSVPMFNTLKEISLATALNPKAQIPINTSLYFGISMPAFITLHILEYTLPIGRTRDSVKIAKIVMGIPFCVTSEIIDKSSSVVLKKFKSPDASLNMQGTMGVPSDLTLSDVLDDMARWNDKNQDMTLGEE